MGILPIVGVAILAYYLTGTKILGLEVSIAALRYKKVSLSKLTLLTDLEIYNPDKKKTVTINSLKLDVIYKGNILSTVSRDFSNIIIVKPLSKTNLKDILISINSLQVISELLSVLLNDAGTTMQVKGTLTADGLKIPINETIELTQA